MKSFISRFSVVLMVLALPGTSFAADRHIYRDTVNTSQSATDVRFTNKHFGLGYTTYLIQLPGNVSGGVTGWLDLSSLDALQFIFGISSTSPFYFGAGALFKHTVAGNASTGFHVGGGALFGTGAGNGIGNSTSFAMNIEGIAGLHFPFPGSPNVLLHIDGGPVFNLVGGSANFGVGPLSGVLGASILYMF